MSVLPVNPNSQLFKLIPDHALLPSFSHHLVIIASHLSQTPQCGKGGVCYWATSDQVGEGDLRTAYLGLVPPSNPGTVQLHKQAHGVPLSSTHRPRRRPRICQEQGEEQSVRRSRKPDWSCSWPVISPHGGAAGLPLVLRCPPTDELPETQPPLCPRKLDFNYYH
jgi:hypothetical protein